MTQPEPLSYARPTTGNKRVSCEEAGDGRTIITLHPPGYREILLWMGMCVMLKLAIIIGAAAWFWLKFRTPVAPGLPPMTLPWGSALITTMRVLPLFLAAPGIIGAVLWFVHARTVLVLDSLHLTHEIRFRFWTKTRQWRREEIGEIKSAWSGISVFSKNRTLLCRLRLSRRSDREWVSEKLRHELLPGRGEDVAWMSRLYICDLRKNGGACL